MPIPTQHLEALLLVHIHTKCFKQHLLKMHHVPFRFTAATETVEDSEMGMSRVRVVSLLPFTSYQVWTN